jgi:hypothetical protein
LYFQETQAFSFKQHCKGKQIGRHTGNGKNPKYPVSAECSVDGIKPFSDDKRKQEIHGRHNPACNGFNVVGKDFAKYDPWQRSESNAVDNDKTNQRQNRQPHYVINNAGLDVFQVEKYAGCEL